MLDYRFLSDQRDTLGITNKDIALSKGLSESTVSRLLRGETKDPSFEVVSAVCDALNVSLDRAAGKYADELPSSVSDTSMSENLRLFRDLFSRVVGYVRAVEHEKDAAFMRQITFRTHLLYGSVILNALLIAFIAGVLLYDITHLDIGWFREIAAAYNSAGSIFSAIWRI